MPRSPNEDVAIVGAGVIGLSCAYFLARRGLKVAVLERKLPGAGARPATAAVFGRSSGRQQTSNSRFLASRTGLSSRFASASTRGFGGSGTSSSLPMKLSFRFCATRSSCNASSASRASSLLRKTCRARWPILDELGFTGGSYRAADGYLNQHRAVHGFAQAAEAAGASIECGVEVIGFDVEVHRIGAVRTTKGTLRTDVVVNCAGAWAPHVAEEIGVHLPIRGRRVQLLHAHSSISLPPDLPWLIGPLGQVHVRHDIPGRVQVGGLLGADETVDALAFDQGADPAWITGVLEQTRETFGIEIERSSVVESWAGLYASTPDQHPIIDRTDAGMIVVGGFAGLGLMHAPAAGLLAAELIIDGKISSVNPADVGLARFSGPIESIERTGF